MDEDELLTRLGAVDLFEGLSHRSLRRLARSGREVQHTSGHEVTLEGGGAVGFHLVLDGAATVTSGGVVRRRLGPGDHFGEVSLIDRQPRSASVVADGSLRTFSLTNDVFQPLLDEEPSFARSLLLVLCKRLRDAEKS